MRYFVLVEKGMPFTFSNLCFIGNIGHLNDCFGGSQWSNEDFEQFCIDEDYTGRIYNIPLERQESFTHDFPHVDESFEHEFNLGE